MVNDRDDVERDPCARYSQTRERSHELSNITKSATVLVTGADGFIGTHLLVKKRFRIQSQHLESGFIVARGFYRTFPRDFRKRASFLGSRSVPLFITSPKETIETECNFEFAKFLISRCQQVSNNVSYLE